jgi:repressor LexA
MIGAGIEDGDIVIISPMLDIINGDIVVAKIDGTDYTLKRFIKQDNLIILQPANDKYKPIILTEEQANERVVVLGIATGVYRRIRRGRNSGTDK